MSVSDKKKKAATKKAAISKKAAPAKPKKKVAAKAAPAKPKKKVAAAAPKPKKAAKKVTAKKAGPKKAAVTAKPIAAPKKPTASFMKDMTVFLEGEKQKILHEVSLKIKSESSDTKFEIGDIYDIASVERERELNLMFGDRDRLKIGEIEDALERIKNKHYGECEECDEPIGQQRLKAMPFTRTCIDCKSKIEQDARVRGRLGEESGFGMLERSDYNDEDES